MQNNEKKLLIYKKNNFEKITIIILMLIGMMYVIFMIPSQVPDEQVHLFRAYEVSEGVLIGKKDCISKVPKELSEKVKPNMENYSQLLENIKGKTDYNEKIEVANSASSYPFILYIFSALGFFIARTFSLNIVIGCYLAKFMNYIVFLMGAYYSLKKLPFGKYAYTTILFMPMFLHQATSTSADSIINTIIMLFVAYVIYLCFKKENINKKEKLILFILTILVSISKYVYFPIVGMNFILIFSKKTNKKEKAIILGMIFIAFIITILGLVNSTQYSSEHTFSGYFEQNNVNPSEQIKLIIKQPLSFLKIIINTIIYNGKLYIYQMVGGALGWLCIPISRKIILVYILIMIISCFAEKNEVSLKLWQRILFILISLVISILIIVGMYISWTGVGNTIVEGVQGRYFVPIMFLLILGIGMKGKFIKIKYFGYMMLSSISILNIFTIISIVRYFIK